MKYNLTLKMFKLFFVSLVKNDITDKNILKNIKKEYIAIMKRASDIGSHNILLTSYALCAFFIAMNRCNSLDVEANYKILESNMKSSKMLKTFLGDSKTYLSEKKMQQRYKWEEQTKHSPYKNDWEVHVTGKDGQYDMGLEYHKCGVCALCKDEGCFEYAKYLCKLDFLLFDIIGLKLDRTMTLADGFDMCDFKIKK